jgi:hypothetical protein
MKNRHFKGIPYSLRSDLCEEIIDGKTFVTSVSTEVDEWGNSVTHSPITRERKEEGKRDKTSTSL